MSEFNLTTPSHFSFKECRWFLDRNHDECLHSVTADMVIKPAVIGGRKVIFELSESVGGLKVKVLYSEGGNYPKEQLTAYILNWLDVEKDLTGFYDVLRKHAELAYMPRDFYGLRLIGIPDLLEAICWCIIGQQINLAFAYKLKRRMVEEYGESIKVNGSIHHFFPKPGVLGQLSIDDLKALQFSRQKADYVIHVAQLINSGELSLDLLQSLDDRDAQLKMLNDVRGIGPWTANYVLMKTLKDMNCVTIGDTGLNSALEQHGLVQNKKDKNEVLSFFENFEGWKSYLVIYLWRSLTKPDFQKV